ncbi:hypothetical protein MKX03_035919, partial [Papaver bracteatum]
MEEVQFLGNRVVTLEERIPRTVLVDGLSLYKVGESSSSQRIGTPNSGAASNYNLAGHRDISPRRGGPSGSSPSGSSPSSRPTGVQVPKKDQLVEQTFVPLNSTNIVRLRAALDLWDGQALFGTLTPDIIVLTILYNTFGLGIAIINDFKSIEGDRAMGLQFSVA